MNQLEATVTLIDFVREQSPEDARVKRALKVFEKRHDILRARHELRHAQIADDIHEEALTLEWKHVVAIYEGTVCAVCMRRKLPRFAFCDRCFRRLDGPTRKAFRGHTFHPAFCRALRIFDCAPTEDTPEAIAVWAAVRGVTL